MLQNVLIVATLCSLISFFLWWTKAKRYWEDRNVPHIKPYPLLGNLNFMLKQNTSIWLRETYQQYRSNPYIGVWLLWKPTIIINCPELAHRILVKDFDVFRNRFMSSGTADIIGSMNLVMVNEPYWAPIRKHLSPAFTSFKLKRYRSIMNRQSSELARRIKIDINQNKCVELRSLFSDFSTDVVSQALFGMESNGTLGGKSPLREATKQFTSFDKLRALEWILLILLPNLARNIGFTFFPKASINYLKSFINMVENQDKDTSKFLSENLLHYILKIKEDGLLKDKDENEDVLIAQAVVFLEAGFESIALTLTHTIYELAYSVEVQEKLYTELSQCCTEGLNNEVLPKLSYLNCVVKESIRKCPPLGWLDRVASEDYCLDKDLVIPAGTPVYINIAGIQSDKKFYPNPDKFDPERFSSEHDNVKNNLTFLSFGDGPRNCIGYKFAFQAVCFATASIVRNFKICPLSDIASAQRDFEKRSLVLSPCKKHTVNFVPR